jgi:hypothetical protein
VAAAVTTVLVAGCSSSKNASTPPNYEPVLAHAVRNTLSAGSAHIVSTQGTSFRSEGSERFRPRQAQAAYEFKGVATRVEVRLIDGVEYVKVPPKLRAQFGNPPTPWISIGTPGHPIASLPIAYTLFAARNVHPIPAIGNSSTAYTGTIQLLDVRTRLPADLRSELSRSFDLQKGTTALADLVGLTPSFRMAIDAHGRIVFIELRSSIDPQKVVMSQELSNFGVEVNVVAPPADQVTPSKTQLGSLA